MYDTAVLIGRQLDLDMTRIDQELDVYKRQSVIFQIEGVQKHVLHAHRLPAHHVEQYFFHLFLLFVKHRNGIELALTLCL